MEKKNKDGSTKWSLKKFNEDVCKSEYCEIPKCKCDKKKSWNVSDKEAGIYRAHGNGIITAKNRAKGKYN
jgi:hypothetical protein